MVLCVQEHLTWPLFGFLQAACEQTQENSSLGKSAFLLYPFFIYLFLAKKHVMTQKIEEICIKTDEQRSCQRVS